VASPQTEVKEALARAGPVELDAGPGRAVLERARFSDVTVSMDGGRALVLAMVEGEGRWRTAAEEVALSYVGREAFAMERCPGAGWCPAGAPLPALAGVLGALAGSGRAGARRIAWQVRVERDRAAVGEDAVGPGGARARRRLDLVRERAGWTIAPGT
jgi:hypothetical protein